MNKIPNSETWNRKINRHPSSVFLGWIRLKIQHLTMAQNTSLYNDIEWVMYAKSYYF
jgi:hypothetical protein